MCTGLDLVFDSQARSSIPAPYDAINEFVIQKLNSLVVADFRFMSAFLHA